MRYNVSGQINIKGNTVLFCEGLTVFSPVSGTLRIGGRIYTDKEFSCCIYHGGKNTAPAAMDIMVSGAVEDVTEIEFM